MSYIQDVRVRVECSCCTNQIGERHFSDCERCAEHPGYMEIWISYQEFLDQIRDDLERRPDPRSEV